jgi:hypothetical protein
LQPTPARNITTKKNRTRRLFLTMVLS